MKSKPNSPTNFEKKIEEILEPMTFNIVSRNYGASSAECRAERILAIEAISNLVEEEVEKAYRKGYNDNARL